MANYLVLYYHYFTSREDYSTPPPPHPKARRQGYCIVLMSLIWMISLSRKSATLKQSISYNVILFHLINLELV